MHLRGAQPTLSDTLHIVLTVVISLSTFLALGLWKLGGPAHRASFWSGQHCECKLPVGGARKEHSALVLATLWREGD